MTSSQQVERGVWLRRLVRSDRVRIRRWMADPRVIRFTVVVPSPEYGPVEPYSEEEADRYFDCLKNDPDRSAFAIEEDGVHVGNVGLKDIDYARGVAACFVEIGDVNVRGRGVGARAMALLLDYAFGDAGLHKVDLGVFEFNIAAIALYKKLGFVDDGVLGVHWVDGRTYSILAMTMTAERWRTPA